ncbi:cell division protein FtsX [Parvibaculum sp.]|uniref:cell division protein FtsX n=1 Tax=Parvibaculum sp. TaxID=2024848 RepID=UPI00391BA13E
MADPRRQPPRGRPLPPLQEEEGRGPGAMLASLLVETRSVMPAAGATGLPLMLVVAAMCFLASLALGAALSVNDKTREWTSEISGSLTVELRPSRDMAAEDQIDAVMSVLAAAPGIVSATPLRREETAALLEPWLGQGLVTDDLPLPSLIDIRIGSKSPPDLSQLAIDIAAAAPGASLDTHRQWRNELMRAALSATWLAFGVLAVVAGTTVAIVIFATRAGLSANREVVEVLHLIGARDRFIASEVQRHFLHLGFRGGLIGTAAGAITFLVLGLAGGAGDMFLIAASGLAIEHYPVLLAIPIAAAFVTLTTARMTVLNSLERML